MPTRKTKAPILSVQKRLKIAKYADKYPDMRLTDIAEIFHVERNQVDYAIKQYKEGKLGTKPPAKSGKKTEELTKEFTPLQLVEQQAHKVIAELTLEKGFALVDKVKLLGEITAVIKSVHQLSLTNHIKRADSVLIGMIIRRFLPDATDSDIVLIYQEELTKCKQL